MADYLKEKLALTESILLYHQGRLLDENTTLATVKQIFGRGLGEVVIHYQY